MPVLRKADHMRGDRNSLLRPVGVLITGIRQGPGGVEITHPRRSQRQPRGIKVPFDPRAMTRAAVYPARPYAPYDPYGMNTRRTRCALPR
jgi:hypothetical protein